MVCNNFSYLLIALAAGSNNLKENNKATGYKTFYNRNQYG